MRRKRHTWVQIYQINRLWSTILTDYVICLNVGWWRSLREWFVYISQLWGETMQSGKKGMTLHHIYVRKNGRVFQLCIMSNISIYLPPTPPHLMLLHQNLCILTLTALKLELLWHDQVAERWLVQWSIVYLRCYMPVVSEWHNADNSS